MKEREGNSKGKEIKYDELSTQKYLQPGNEITAESMKWIFSIRSRDLAIKGNFKGAHEDKECVIEKCNEVETQRHIYTCPFLTDPNELIPTNVTYDDIFGDNVEKQVKVMLTMKSRILK